MKLVAGVDSSTQSCKVVIRDAETGALVATGRAAHPDGTEVDPESWWVALQAALKEALAARPPGSVAGSGSVSGAGSVAAISIAGQQHGMVALDETGRVIRPALLWNDTRSAGAALDLIRELGAHAWAERTGVVPNASFTVTKLRWLRQAEPANAARVAAVALPHDWLSWRLRGFGPEGESPLGAILEELETDRSDASGTGYWSPATDKYDRKLLARALGHQTMVPRVLGPSTAMGTPVTGFLPVGDSSLSLDGAIVGPGAGDNAGAALGLSARPRDVVVSIGSSGTVFAVSTTPVRDSAGVVAGFADASGHYLPLVATLNAARALDAAAALFGCDHEQFARLALTARPGAGGAVLVPWFEGERTPSLPNARACLSGLSLENTNAANVARATVEGVLCSLADGLDAVRAHGVPADRILLIGGGAANGAVRRVAAQVFDVPVVVPEPGEYVADGAAKQAAWVLTGEFPEWPVGTEAEFPVGTEAVIRDQYREAVRRAT